MGGKRRIESVGRDVADMDLCPGVQEALGDGAADTGSAGGDDDALGCPGIGICV